MAGLNLGTVLLNVALQTTSFTTGLSTLSRNSRKALADLEITANVSSNKIAAAFKTGVSQAGGSIQNLAKVAGQAFGVITSPVGIASTALVGLGAGFATAVGDATKFEAKMSGVAAVTKASGIEIKQLEKLALEAGKTTAYTSVQAADAIEELAKAGVSTANIIGGALNGALSLAASTGMTNLGDAALISAQAMNSFNLQGKDVGRIADVIANAANKSAVDVNGFRLGLQAAGSVASKSRLSLEEFSAMLSIMANNGIKGSDAGTSLKTMLLRLQAPTETASKAMAKLGLDIYDANGRMLPFTSQIKGAPTIMANLEKAFAGLTEKSRNHAASVIFGTDGMRAFNILTKAGPQGLIDMTKAMQEQGSAAEASKKRLDNLAGAVKIFLNSINVLSTQIGLIFTPTLTLIVREATKVITVLVDVAAAIRGVVDQIREWLKPYVELISKNQVLMSVLDGVKVAVGVLAGSTGLILLVSGFGALANVIKAAVLPSLTAVYAALGPILVPLALIAAAVAALYVAWRNNFLGIRDVTDKGVKWIELALKKVPIYFTAVIKTAIAVGEVFANVFGGIGNILSGFGDLVFIYVVRPLANMAVSIGKTLTGAASLFGGFINTLGQLMKPLVDFFASIGIAFGNFISSSVNGLIKVLSDAAGKVASDAGKAINDGAKGSPETQAALAKMAKGFNQIGTAADGAGVKITKAWTDANAAASKITLTADAIKPAVVATTSLGMAADQAGTKVVDFGKKVVKTTQEMVNALIPAARQLVKTLNDAKKSGDKGAIEDATIAINAFKKANQGGAEAIAIVTAAINAQEAATKKTAAAAKKAADEAERLRKQRVREAEELARTKLCFRSSCCCVEERHQ